MSERHSELRVLRWSERIQDVLAGGHKGPIRANIDLTNLCSHACPWCEPLDFRKATIADKSHTLSVDVAFDLLRDLKEMDCKAIQFSGGGEPTLHAEFGPILDSAWALDFRTLVVTHGGYLDRWSEYLLSSANHVRVSLDASCEKEHRIMHGTKAGEFGKVVENIRALVVARGAAKTPEVGITYNMADCNTTKESGFRIHELAVKLGVDYVQFRPLSEPTPQFRTTLRNFNWTESSIPPRMMVLDQRDKDVFYQREFGKCYASLTLAVISANGAVSACCDRRDIAFGNVNETRFKDIWLSATHCERARTIVPRLCTRCVLCGYNRSVEKYVVNNEAVPEII